MKMVVIGEYVLVENIDELKKNAIWEDDKNIRVSALGIFHYINQVIYPCAFRYVDAYDSNFYGDYIPCSKREMALVVKVEIMRFSSKIERLNRVLEILNDKGLEE
jgi:hypothetical protein